MCTEMEKSEYKREWVDEQDACQPVQSPLPVMRTRQMCYLLSLHQLGLHCGFGKFNLLL